MWTPGVIPESRVVSTYMAYASHFGRRLGCCFASHVIVLLESASRIWQSIRQGNFILQRIRGFLRHAWLKAGSGVTWLLGGAWR